MKLNPEPAIGLFAAFFWWVPVLVLVAVWRALA